MPSRPRDCREPHVGFELFDEKKLGASDFEQRVDYQRALEGEIARTIEGIDGVQAAEVQLVLPDDSLFIDEASPATAAVLLTAAPALDSSAVAGISQLVSSSVESLTAKNVIDHRWRRTPSLAYAGRPLRRR